jgi:hypothetical protein
MEVAMWHVVDGLGRRWTGPGDLVEMLEAWRLAQRCGLALYVERVP